jgi:hypothetical protein
MFTQQCHGLYITDILAVWFRLTVMITQSMLICHATGNGLNSAPFSTSKEIGTLNLL